MEGELRSVAAKAAELGDWPLVRCLSLAAEQLKPVLEESVSPHAQERAAKPPRKRAAASRAGNGSVYPRFARQADDLVKVGWSKREKGEYRHRAPVKAVIVVAAAVAEEVRRSELLSPDALFPVIDPADGGEVASYQTYLTLRWFRQLELIEQQGRSGYAVPDPDGLVDAVRQALKQLPEDQAVPARGQSQKGASR